MKQQVVLGDLTTQLHNLRIHAVQANAFFLLAAEDERATMFEEDRRIVLGFLARGVFKRAIVEDVAILIDFDERRSLVFRSAFENVGKMLDVDVDATCDERRLSTDRHGKRVQGEIDRPHR